MSAKITKTTSCLRLGPIKTKALPTISWGSRFGASRGFTLIEILIVMAIVSFVIAMGLPAIERITLQRLNSTTREFTGRIRSMRNDAILLNNVYRLAIDLDNQTWWVEAQREQRLLGQEEMDEANSQKKKKKRKKGERDERPSNFSPVEKYARQPVPMPGGVVFDGVLKEREGLMKEGVVYIHFFPNGYTEQAILYLNKEGSQTSGYSLVLRPTLGKVEISRSRISDFNAVVTP